MRFLSAAFLTVLLSLLMLGPAAAAGDRARLVPVPQPDEARDEAMNLWWQAHEEFKGGGVPQEVGNDGPGGLLGLWNGFKNTVVTAWDLVEDDLSHARDWATNGIAAAWGWTTRTLGTAWDWTTNALATAWDSTTSALATAWDWTTDKLVDAWDWTGHAKDQVVSWVSDKWDSLPNWARGAIKGVGAAVAVVGVAAAVILALPAEAAAAAVAAVGGAAALAAAGIGAVLGGGLYGLSVGGDDFHWGYGLANAFAGGLLGLAGAGVLRLARLGVLKIGWRAIGGLRGYAKKGLESAFVAVLTQFVLDRLGGSPSQPISAYLQTAVIAFATGGLGDVIGLGIAGRLSLRQLHRVWNWGLAHGKFKLLQGLTDWMRRGGQAVLALSGRLKGIAGKFFRKRALKMLEPFATPISSTRHWVAKGTAMLVGQSQKLTERILKVASGGYDREKERRTGSR